MVYQIGKSGKRLGSVQADSEKEALQEAYKQFAKTEAERQRIYARAMKGGRGSAYRAGMTEPSLQRRERLHLLTQPVGAI